MEILEQTRDWAWMLVFAVSALVAVLTFLRIQEKTGVRIGFALMRGVIFFGMLCLPLIEQPRLSAGAALPVAGIVLLILGLCLVIGGSADLKKARLRGMTGVPDKVITTGLYSVIRHPINLGFMLAFPGWYLLWNGISALLFPPVLVVVLVLETSWEERKIQKTLGDAYVRYKERVGMFFPKIWTS